jgi:quercetin dioxygenase-like cupin family protein
VARSSLFTLEHDATLKRFFIPYWIKTATLPQNLIAKQTMSQNKRIEATSIRPDGDRLLYAPLVEMNINKFIKQLKSEEAWNKDKHNTITIYKSDSTTIVLRGMHKKSTRKSGKVNNDATIQVLKGKIKILAGATTIQLKRGQMLGISADTEHSVEAVRDSFYLLTVIGTV